MQHPTKRRRGHIPDSAGLDWANPEGTRTASTLLRLEGLPCSIFANKEFYPEDHLIPWLGDEKTLVDRFDGRLLLDSLTSWSERSRPPVEAEDFTEEDLQSERYAEMDPSKEARLESVAGWYNPNEEEEEEEEEMEEAGAEDDSSPADAESLSAVGYSYGPPSEENQNTVLEAAVPVDEPFEPTFEVPEGLQVPAGRRMHEIIVKTAAFVRAAGRQSEFVLRVKHAQNPNFSFLLPQDKLHGYFEWLLKTDPEVIEAGTGRAGKGAEDLTADGSSALGLLSNYGSESAESPASERQPPAQAAAEAPPDVQAIVEKLVKFVQQGGRRFEASVREREKGNPKFCFMYPGHEHHAFYRGELSKALGHDEADAMLRAGGTVKQHIELHASESANQELAAAAGTARLDFKPQSSVSLPPSNPCSIKANPSLVKIVTRPRTEEATAKREDRSAGEPGAAHEGPATQMREQRTENIPAQRSTGAKYEESDAVVGSLQVVDDDTEFLRATEGPSAGRQLRMPAQKLAEVDELELLEAEGKRAAPVDTAAEAERKAQRRRLARDLLLQKQGKKSAAEPADRKNTVDVDIAHLRAKLLAEEGGPAGEDIDGAGGSVQADIRCQRPMTQRLPKLDELLSSKRRPHVSSLSDFEVLPRAADPAKGKGRPRGLGAMSSSSPDDAQDDGWEHKSGSKRKGSRRSEGDRRRKHSKSSSHSSEATSELESADMRERIRALLRAQQ